jgi:hypothetical protein
VQKASLLERLDGCDLAPELAVASASKPLDFDCSQRRENGVGGDQGHSGLGRVGAGLLAMHGQTGC